MNIGIDIDDTISNTYDILFNYAQKYTIDTLKRSGDILEVKKSTSHNYCAIMHNWTELEEIQFFNKYYKNLLQNVQPKPFSIEIINRLKQEGNKIYLITARFGNETVLDPRKETVNWLQKYGINYDELIMEAKSPEDKLSAIKQNKIDVFIDDSLGNCEISAQNGIKTYIMDSKVNTDVKEDNITRIYSWPHFYQKIKEEI